MGQDFLDMQYLTWLLNNYDPVLSLSLCYKRMMNSDTLLIAVDPVYANISGSTRIFTICALQLNCLDAGFNQGAGMRSWATKLV